MLYLKVRDADSRTRTVGLIKRLIIGKDELNTDKAIDALKHADRQIICVLDRFRRQDHFGAPSMAEFVFAEHKAQHWSRVYIYATIERIEKIKGPLIVLLPCQLPAMRPILKHSH